jgi:hypothetical protein
MSKTVCCLSGVGVAIVLTLTNNSHAWSPGGGEESALFNQYVTEQLVYDPPDPVYNEWGDFVGWNGPTYEQQWNAEYNRRIQEGNQQQQIRQGQISQSAQQTQSMTNAIREDGTIRSPELDRQAQSESEAVQRVSEARQLQVDGPTTTEKSRMQNRATAGGRLDANRDGVIDKSEREAALATRVSMKSQQFLDERKIDLDGDGSLDNNESKSELMNTAGVNILDHNAMIGDLKATSDYETPSSVNQNQTYVDARGQVSTVASLNNSQALQQSYAAAVGNSQTAATSANQNPVTRQDVFNAANTSGRNYSMPNTVTSSSRIQTGGTWGRVHTDSKTYNVNSGATAKQNSFGGQLNGITTQDAKRNLGIQ